MPGMARPPNVPHFLGTDLGAGHADVRDAFECPSGLPHFLSTDVGAEHADVRDALHSSLVQRKCPLDILQKIPCSSSVLSFHLLGVSEEYDQLQCMHQRTYLHMAG